MPSRADVMNRSSGRFDGTKGERRESAPPPDPSDGTAAAASAMRILNGAAQSADGLARRLIRKGFDEATAATAVARMREYGYVDDVALANSVANRRERNGYGRARIAADLRGRHVDPDVVAATVAGLDSAGDVNRAVEVAQRAWRPGDGGRSDRDRNRRRIAGMLQRRGFGGDVVSAALRQLEAQQATD